MSFIDDLRKNVTNGARAKKAKKEPVADKCPGLWELLTQTAYANGDKRQTASLTIWYDPAGVWQCSLHEREEGLKWFAEALTFEGLAEALESVLRDPERPPRETVEGKRKRAKAADAEKKLDKGK